MPADVTGAPPADDFSHYLKRGYSSLQSNNLVEAKEDLEKALEIRPGDNRTLNLLAMVFFKLEQYPKAIKIFRQLIKMNPAFPTLYMNLGMAYIKQGDYTAALPELQKILEMEPGHANARNYLGLVFSQLGRFDEARREFEQTGNQGMVAKMDEKINAQQRYSEGGAAAGTDAALDQAPAADAFSSYDPSSAYPVPPPEAPPQEYGDAAPPPPEYAEAPPPDGGMYADPYAQEGAVASAALPAGGDQPAPDAVPPYNVPLSAPDGVPEDLNARRHEAGVLDAASPTAIRSLKELSRSLTISKENIPALHLRNEKLLQVVLKGGQVYARLGAMVASEGGLVFDQSFKRFRGKETKAIFGGQDDPVMKITGEGQLLLTSQDRLLHVFNLEDELIYLAENAVFAFQDGIQWENGRIQTEGTDDLNLAQFKGRGTVCIAARGKLVSIPVTSRSSLTVEFHSLVGWFGKIVPQVKIVGGMAGSGKNKKTVVELKGDGDCLIEEKITP